MYVLNITFFVKETIENQWIEWSKKRFERLKNENDYFHDFKLCRMISHQEPDQVTYACQLHAHSFHQIQLFELELEQQLMDENKHLFGEQSVFFKSLMQIIK